jgi:hypothetical protein
MRRIALVAVMLALCACTQKANLYRGVYFSGVGYDIRPANPPVAGVYECSAVYDNEHAKDRVQIGRTLLYRCLAQVKKDGYEFVSMEGPTGVTLTRTVTRSYASSPTVSTDTTNYPGLSLKLTGYKADGSRPAGTSSIDEVLAKLKPTVGDV